MARKIAMNRAVDRGGLLEFLRTRRHPAGSDVLLADDWMRTASRSGERSRCSTCTGALEPLVDYYRAIFGEHLDWDESHQTRAVVSHEFVSLAGWPCALPLTAPQMLTAGDPSILRRGASHPPRPTTGRQHSARSLRELHPDGRRAP